VVAKIDELEIPLERAPAARDDKRTATVGVRPEHLAILPAGQGNATAEVYVVEPMGREQIVDVQVGARRLRAIAPPGFAARIGDRVGLGFAPERIHLFDPASGERIA
jgi:ABC-type sugar transport system ATPase subunit